MGRLFQKIGSFAGDYSGAASVLQEMDGMVVFCDAGACAGGFLFGEDPKGGNEERRIFTASLREKQVIMGIDKKVKTDAVRTYKEVGGEFLALIGTPVAAVIGADLEGIGKETCKELYKEGLTDQVIPSFGIDTNGWDAYDIGQEKAYLALLDTFVNKNVENIADVNVIGATSIDMWDYNQIDDCLKSLKKAGALTPVVWGANGGIKEISGAASAKLNIAVSVSGIKVVKEMKKRYGTPYLIGYPIGETQTRRWEEKVKQILNDEVSKEVAEQKSGHKESGKRALIIAEQLTACAIRELLREKFGYEQVDVASFFKMDKQFMEINDFQIKEEAMLRMFMNDQKKYDLLLADPFVYPVLPYQPRQVIALPHMAISSVACLGMSANIYGEKADIYFKQKLEGQVG